MNKKILFILIVIILLTFAVNFTHLKNPSKVYSFNDFVKKIGEMKNVKGRGVFPDPPRAIMKEAEKFLKSQVKNSIKINYSFTTSISDDRSAFNLIFYSTPDPFRWRIDFIMRFKDGEYKNSYFYDGSNYYSCIVEPNTKANCYVEQKDFIEKHMSTPLVFTDFLNDFLDPLSLKKLVGEVNGIRERNSKKYSKTIASYLGDCQIAEDQYSIIDFCINREKNILLFIDLKRKANSGKIIKHYSLTAEEIDFSQIFENLFTPL